MVQSVGGGADTVSRSDALGALVMVDTWDTGAHQRAYVDAHHIGLDQHQHTVCDLLWPTMLHDGLLSVMIDERNSYWRAMTEADQYYFDIYAGGYYGDYGSKCAVYGVWGYGMGYTDVVPEAGENSDGMRTCGLVPLARHATLTQKRGMSGLKLSYQRALTGVKYLASMVMMPDVTAQWLQIVDGSGKLYTSLRWW